MENRKRLWIFNPDCEMAIANGSKYYMPPANVVTMAEDLAVLPVFLGESEDGLGLSQEFTGSGIYGIGL